MLDLKLVRDDPERVKAALAKRGPGVADQVDRLLEADATRRRLVTEVDALRAEQKRRGREVARAAPAERDQALAGLPTASVGPRPACGPPRPSWPRSWPACPTCPTRRRRPGARRTRSSCAAGAPAGLRFPGPRPPGAGRAAGRDRHRPGGQGLGRPLRLPAGAGGHARVRPCPLRHGPADGCRVRARGPSGAGPPGGDVRTGFLPTDEQQIFRTADDDLYLAGTSEVPLVSYHSDELLDPGALPLRYAGFSTCFRREAGSYGKDTRGIFRVHQFDKVEMVSFVLPEASGQEHELLLAREEEILQALELPYRVVNIAAGDLGGSAAQKYDCEAWIPSQGSYRELTSTSNCTDYQARRIGCRVREPEGNRPLHTLNGTAVAVGRTIVALLENHQQADGSVMVPAALRQYLGSDCIEPSK